MLQKRLKMSFFKLTSDWWNLLQVIHYHVTEISIVCLPVCPYVPRVCTRVHVCWTVYAKRTHICAAQQEQKQEHVSLSREGQRSGESGRRTAGVPQHWTPHPINHRLTGTSTPWQNSTSVCGLNPNRESSEYLLCPEENTQSWFWGSKCLDETLKSNRINKINVFL